MIWSIVHTVVGKKVRDAAILNSKEMKPVAISIVELCLDRSIRTAVSQVSRTKNKINKPHKVVGWVWGQSEDIFGLGYSYEGKVRLVSGSKPL